MAKMTELNANNYRGSLYVKEGGGKFYWAVECDMEDQLEWEWFEIPKSLYDEIVGNKELAA